FVFPTTGVDLRWRAELHSLSPVRTPRIDQITITGNPPVAVADLKASKYGDQCLLLEWSRITQASKDGDKCLLLEWSRITQDVNGDAISGVTYNVYRALNDFYFTPDQLYAWDLTDPSDPSDPPSYLDPDAVVLSDSSHNASYLVTAVSAGLESDVSNRVGTFVFDLVPGGP
ncbi:MAG: hypothetical protein GY743_14045, partial [Planctomycetaceae bacterium]|nr:hypothetical protein [Planctomycetaceae bacterium]